MKVSVTQRLLRILICTFSLSAISLGAARVHVIGFGKTISVPWVPDSEGPPRTLKVRPLLVDARVKEYVMGPAHDVTDRLFVVRRVFRMNDSLPEDSAPHWQWQRGGWLMVDRLSGRISPINLPDFDSLYSNASWYRDYVAYCGVSDEGRKVEAIVAQIGRRKPVLKKSLSNEGLSEDAAPDSACLPPSWQRGPARVSFAMAEGPKQIFSIRGRVVDVVSDEENEGSR